MVAHEYMSLMSERKVNKNFTKEKFQHFFCHGYSIVMIRRVNKHMYS